MYAHGDNYGHGFVKKIVIDPDGNELPPLIFPAQIALAERRPRPVCKEPLTEETGWHIHHIIWRCYGGPDTAENRILRHPTCHRSVQARVTEEPPRPCEGHLSGLSGMP